MKTLLDNARLVASGSKAAGSVAVLSERATVLATYALAGFANIGSIGGSTGRSTSSILVHLGDTELDLRTSGKSSQQ